MGFEFTATAVREATSVPAHQTLSLTLADATGQTSIVTVTAELARMLACVLGEFAGAVPSAMGTAQRPRSFAVGAGTHERAVMLRFEQSPPYHFAAEDAFRLAHALLEQCEVFAEQSPTSLQ